MRSWLSCVGLSAVLLTLVAVAAGGPAADAQGDPLVEAMRELSEDTEDTLHWLMRGDFRQLEHLSVELRRSVDLNISIAQTQGLSPGFLRLLLDIREQAEQLGEEAKETDLRKTGKAYLAIIELCMECHVESP